MAHVFGPRQNPGEAVVKFPKPRSVPRFLRQGADQPPLLRAALLPVLPNPPREAAVARLIGA